MKNIEFLVSKDAAERISSIDASIAHWSVQHSRLLVQAQEALSTIKNLYEAHGQLVLSIAGEEGHDVKKATGYKVVTTPQGKLVQVTVDDSEESQIAVAEQPKLDTAHSEMS